MRKERWQFPLFLLTITALLVTVLLKGTTVLQENYGLLSALIIAAALIFLYWRFEKSSASAREIAVIAVLGTIAAVGRIPFAGLLSIQPTTFIVITSGFVFGSRAGFMTGATAAVVSNFFLGQGPWTPWQMFAWGLAGTTGGLLKRIYPGAGARVMVAFNFIWGYIFGWILNLYFWTTFIFPLNWQTFMAAYAASFWFDTFHALGNAAFYMLFGMSLTRILNRFNKKLQTTYLP